MVPHVYHPLLLCITLDCRLGKFRKFVRDARLTTPASAVRSAIDHAALGEIGLPDDDVDDSFDVDVDPHGTTSSSNIRFEGRVPRRGERGWRMMLCRCCRYC